MNARNELAEKVFDLLTRVAEVGTSNRNVIAHGIAMGLEDAGWSKPRTVTTVAELEALPIGSVIWYSLRYDGQAMYSVMEKGLDGTWLSAMDPEDDYAYKPLLPATVLFTPGGE